jgi:hypothetical protein
VVAFAPKVINAPPTASHKGGAESMGGWVGGGRGKGGMRV